MIVAALCDLVNGCDSQIQLSSVQSWVNNSLLQACIMIKNQAFADNLAGRLNSGYWRTSDGVYWFNKAHALRHATQTHTTVSYHFFDSVWNSVDWSEPRESWDHLCAERAQQLRDSYDYLVLSFSGGSDSSHVLDTFVRNGIALDEVLVFFSVAEAEQRQSDWNPRDTRGANYMFEYVAAVKPQLRWLAENHPQIKITVIDNTVSKREQIQLGHAQDLALSGMMMAPGQSGLVQARDHVLQYGNQAAIIYGIDKPRLGYDSVRQQFYTYFFDLTSVYGHWTTTPGVYTQGEYFYHTPQMPRLLVKSTQMLHRAARELLTGPELLKSQVFKPSRVANRSIVDVHHWWARRVLYPRYDMTTFQVQKMNSLWWTEYSGDIWREKSARDRWAGQLAEFTHGIDERFLMRNAAGDLDKFCDFSTALRYLPE